MRVRLLLAGLLIAAGSVFAVAGPAFAQEEETETEHDISHEAEECIHVLEEGGDPEDCHAAPSAIAPAWNELIWGGAAFLLLMLLLSRVALPALKKGMEDRTQRIRDNLDEAERTKSDAERILEDYQRQLADAKNESARIIEEARQTAEQMRRDLVARAEQEATEMRERNRTEIEGARDRALADIRSQVTELAIGAAEAVVQRNLDRDTQRALVESYIDQVGSGNGGR